MSNTSASTFRSEPNSRVENHTNPIALYTPTAPRALMMSISSLWTGLSLVSTCGGRRLSMMAVMSANVSIGGMIQQRRKPDTSSNTNGTAANRMLNAMPPARKKMLSSPELSHTRFA